MSMLPLKFTISNVKCEGLRLSRLVDPSVHPYLLPDFQKIITMNSVPHSTNELPITVLSTLGVFVCLLVF